MHPQKPSVMSGGAGDPPPPPPPPPPELPPVLSACMDSIIHLALTDSSPDLTLSAAYRSALLQPDPLTTYQSLPPSHFPSGVPPHPLYKPLARSIHACMASGDFPGRPEATVGLPPEEGAAARETEWKEWIAGTGIELSDMLETVEFQLHVQDPFFSQLRAGKKTVEGRCATDNYSRISQGSLLLFNQCFLLKVQHVKWYNSFSEMLETETLENVLPGVETIEEGVQIYRKFYSEEKEMSNGVLAISVSKPSSQPYILMANLLSRLSYDGIGHLLGTKRTVGTVPDALPPARSSLISSSLMRHRPNVKGCSLTNAARALAKHVNRCSDGWWGSFSGSDSDKNSVASDVINRLLTDCCWMNVHLIRPFECVFEIRVPEGYGARWSRDGSKFIGFLEPYMEEGYSKGWKH